MRPRATPSSIGAKLGAAVVTDYSKGTHSFGRIFTVDEIARTYELETRSRCRFRATSAALSASAIRTACSWHRPGQDLAEYDRYGLPIATHEMEAEKYIYRVYKYEL